MAGPDVVIAGGGPAGASAAILLARGGVNVHLIERTRGAHHKVCGEFLSTEAISLLGSLGLDLAALGAAPIHRLGIAQGHKALEITLPFPALSLSRDILDEALLVIAAKAGATVQRGASVAAARHTPQGWQVRLDDRGEIVAPEFFVATGKHDLRGHPRPDGSQNDLIGFKLHLTASLAILADMDGRVDLVGLPQGYAGLQLVGSGCLNLCLLVRRSEFARYGTWDRYASHLVAAVPRLAAVLADASPLWRQPLAVGQIPYGFVRADTGGAWWLGDQAAVIPSFSGDGISIALWSGMQAARTYLGSGAASAFQSDLASDVSAQVRRATVLSSFMVKPWFQQGACGIVGLMPALGGAIARRTRLTAAL